VRGKVAAAAGAISGLFKMSTKVEGTFQRKEKERFQRSKSTCAEEEGAMIVFKHSCPKLLSLKVTGPDAIISTAAIPLQARRGASLNTLTLLVWGPGSLCLAEDGAGALLFELRRYFILSDVL
jgi:hypothetical protein